MAEAVAEDTHDLSVRQRDVPKRPLRFIVLVVVVVLVLVNDTRARGHDRGGARGGPRRRLASTITTFAMKGPCSRETEVENAGISPVR